MSQRNKQAPSNWDAYERGRAGSLDSLVSITESEPQNDFTGTPSTPNFASRTRGSDAQNESHTLRERKSSMMFDSIRRMGGVNSIDNFARSFQRAAGYRTITPARRGSISFDQDGEVEEGSSESAQQHGNKSLLRQQLEGSGPQSHDSATQETPRTQVEDGLEETAPLLHAPSHATGASLSVRSRSGLENVAVLGTSYGSISSRLTATAQRRASILIKQQHEASMRAREDDGESKDDVTEHQVEVETRDDGEVIERIVGESTVPMTIFNSINVLIGVGILALPLAIKYSGWVIGLTFLTCAALVTNYTAKLLAKCMDTNSACTTYGDIAFLSFGDMGRGLVEFMFVIELLAANVALIILFADSMNLLVPSVGTIVWKAILAIGLLPLNFVPLKTLSVTSVLGIVCCMGIITLVFVDGLIKPHSPGSLREVATTYAFPADWRTIPLSLGLFMSPWGGHSVFPAVYRDMRHPQKYPRALRTTYLFTYGLDLTMAVLGYIMFGEGVRDEITSNILTNKSYPQVVSFIIVVLIAIIPITKIPLSNRPMMDTLNKKFLIDLRQMDAKARAYSEKSVKHRAGRTSIALLCNFLELGIAIALPDFDSIMALMGSALCFLICVILPIAFYLTIFDKEGHEVSTKERIVGWILMVICTILAIIGTVFAIIPKDRIGAEACHGLLLCMSR